MMRNGDEGRGGGEGKKKGFLIKGKKREKKKKRERRKRDIFWITTHVFVPGSPGSSTG